MPRVLLTQQARQEALDAQRNEALIWAIKTIRARLGRTYTDTADAVGITRSHLHNLTNSDAVNNARFGLIRNLSHEIGMTKEEWLRLGGF